MKQANVLREKNPEQYIDIELRKHVPACELMMQLHEKGAITFDYGNNIRARALEYEAKISSQNAEACRFPFRGRRGFLSRLCTCIYPSVVL